MGGLSTGFCIRSRIEARDCGLKHFFSGVACIRGHIDRRLVVNGQCVTCLRECTRAWRKRNPERNRELAKKYSAVAPKRKRSPERLARDRLRRAANREAINQKRRKSYQSDGGERKAANRAWRAKNWQKARAVERASEQKHVGRKNETRRSRQAAQMQRTPPWADRKAMRAIYNEAAKLSRETGTSHHVDHIVPLQGECVSGLHVAWNLQILKAVENIRKGAKWSPSEIGACQLAC